MLNNQHKGTESITKSPTQFEFLDFNILLSFRFTRSFGNVPVYLPVISFIIAIPAFA